MTDFVPTTTVSILIASSGPQTAAMRCLLSLIRTAPETIDFEVIFVDNGTSDGTSALLARFAGDLDVIRNETDLGYATGLGQAVRRSRGQVLIALRSDLVTCDGWLPALLRALDRKPAIDAVRPEVIGPADNDRTQGCIAARREVVLGSEAQGVEEPGITDEELGRRLLSLEFGADLVPDSLMTVSGDLDVSEAAPPQVAAPFTVAEPFGLFEYSPWATVLFDGSQHPVQRVVAGVNLYCKQPIEAVAANVASLLERMTAANRDRVASLLEDGDQRIAFDQIRARSHRDDEDAMFPGIYTGYRPNPTPQPSRDEAVASLQLFNDILAASPLAGRYWIYSGMLLGWAREGDLIKGDYHDFDFAVQDEDWGRLQQASIELIKAGFLPRSRFPSFGLRCNVLVFQHGAIRFEIYRMDSDGPDHWRSYSYGGLYGADWENVHRFRRQPLVPIDFLDRLWLKVLDHETELTDDYGDWHTPDPDWNYMLTHTITRREHWDARQYDLVKLAVNWTQ